METMVSIVLVFSAALLYIPVAIFFVEIAATTTIRWREKAAVLHRDFRPRVAVLVPAHNEGRDLLPTLLDIRSQLDPGDRVIVVADNCVDDTPAIAAKNGAEVVERRDPARIGKGYALDFGIRNLNSDPPDIVIFVDADCRLERDALAELRSTCATLGRPVQALYLMTSPEEAAVNHRVAEFAWRVKNWCRPLGLKALGLPCQLMGTGMAVPWDVIRVADLASGLIVEDVQLGLDLTKAGHAPVFCPSARVTSTFASSTGGALSQRTRWEHGHIHTILNVVPRLIWQALRGHNMELLALALDIAVPPLTLLVMLVLGIFLLAALGTFIGSSHLALWISFANVLVLSVAVTMAWLKFGRAVVPLAAIFSIAPYMLGKVGFYGRLFFRRMETRWIRTDRTKSG